MKTRPPRPSFRAAAAMVIFLTTTLHAATYTWTGNATGTGVGWGHENNWSPSGTPNFNSSADIIFSSGNSRRTNFIGSDRTIRSLMFNASATNPVFIQLQNSAGDAGANLILGSASVSPTITVNTSATTHTIGSTPRGSVVLLNDLTAAINAGGLKIGRPVSGNFGITKTGDGRLNLIEVNTYTGLTDVQKGTILLSGSTASAGFINISSGATLGGSGSGGVTTLANGATLTPGDDGSNTLTLASLSLSPGSFLNFELDSPWLGEDPVTPDFNPGFYNDHVHLTGALALSGRLNVTARPGGGFETHVLGSKWLLLKADGALTGTLPTLGVMPTPKPGLSYAIQTTGDGQVLLVVVPEAGTVSLMAAGLLLMRLLLRRGPKWRGGRPA